MTNRTELCLDVLLLGGPQSGKSATGNSLLGSCDFPSSLSPGAVTEKCRLGQRIFPAFLRRQGEETALRLRVLDTPAYPSTFLSPELVRQAVTEATGQAFEGGPHALVLVVRADVPYSEGDGRLARLAEDLFGSEWGSHALLMLTHGDCVDEARLGEEEYLTLASRAFRALLSRVQHRYQFVDNSRVWHQTERTPLLENLLLLSRRNRYRGLQLKSI